LRRTFRLDNLQVLRVGDPHVQALARNALDAGVHRPGTRFKLQLTVFDFELPGTFQLLLKLGEELARLMLRCDQPQCARREDSEKEQV